MVKRPTPKSSDSPSIIFVYHKISKRIVKHQSSFTVLCPQCGTRKEDKYMYKDIGDVLHSLLFNGWKDVERGIAE